MKFLYMFLWWFDMFYISVHGFRTYGLRDFNSIDSCIVLLLLLLFEFKTMYVP